MEYNNLFKTLYNLTHIEAEIEHAFAAGMEYNKILESIKKDLDITESEWNTIKNKAIYRGTSLNKLERIRYGNYKQLTLITNKYPTRTNTNNTEEIGKRINGLEEKIRSSN